MGAARPEDWGATLTRTTSAADMAASRSLVQSVAALAGNGRGSRPRNAANPAAEEGIQRQKKKEKKQQRGTPWRRRTS